MARLRTATWTAHQSLEKQVDVRHRFSSLAEYQGHLVRMWGFCAGLESHLADEQFADVLPDYAARRKLPLLKRDLTALGLSSDTVDTLPICRKLPDCSDTAAALGCVYVLEGSTLGGQTLLPVVESRLGLHAGHGAAFLASYGAEVGPMWKRFGQALEQWCVTPERRERAEFGAETTFSRLSDWLAEARS